MDYSEKLGQINKFIVPYLSKYYGQDKKDLSHKRRLTIEDHKTIYKQRKSEPRQIFTRNWESGSH